MQYLFRQTGQALQDMHPDSEETAQLIEEHDVEDNVEEEEGFADLTDDPTVLDPEVLQAPASHTPGPPTVTSGLASLAFCISSLALTTSPVAPGTSTLTLAPGTSTPVPGTSGMASSSATLPSSSSSQDDSESEAEVSISVIILEYVSIWIRAILFTIIEYTCAHVLLNPLLQ